MTNEDFKQYVSLDRQVEDYVIERAKELYAVKQSPLPEDVKGIVEFWDTNNKKIFVNWEISYTQGVDIEISYAELEKSDEEWQLYLQMIKDAKPKYSIHVDCAEEPSVTSVRVESFKCKSTCDYVFPAQTILYGTQVICYCPKCGTRHEINLK